MQFPSRPLRAAFQDGTAQPLRDYPAFRPAHLYGELASTSRAVNSHHAGKNTYTKGGSLHGSTLRLRKNVWKRQLRTDRLPHWPQTRRRRSSSVRTCRG